MSTMGEGEIRRILVMRFRALGDALLSVPLCRALKRSYPEAHVDYLVEAPLAPLFAGSPDMDGVLAWPRRARPRWRSDLHWARRIRRARYDLVVDLHGSGTSVFFTALSGAPRRLGYKVRGRHWFYTEKIDRTWPASRPPVYQAARPFRLVESLGVFPEDLRLRLGTWPPELDRLPWRTPEAPHVVVAPGATWSAKAWPPASYAELIRRLLRRGWDVVLTGAPHERHLIAALAADTGATDAGSLRLRQLAEIIADADLLISTDSGARHLAVALETPSLGIFGSTDPRIWSIDDPLHPIVRRSDLDCLPCSLTSCPLPGHPCMSGLSVDQVEEAAAALLARTARAGRS